MRRAVVLAAAALCAAFAAAADAAGQPDFMRTYKGLVKVSSGRTFSLATNGVTSARFMGNIFGDYAIWNQELQVRLADMPTGRIRILSTMVGDRVDFSLDGKVPASAQLGRELAAMRVVNPGLYKFIPANASVVYVSAVPGESPIDRHVLPIRAKIVEQMRALMPPRATYRDFAMFAAPARKGGGIAIVCVFRLASAVPPLDSLAGKRISGVFTLSDPNPAAGDPPRDGFYRYSVTSSFRDALGGNASDGNSEMLRFAAAANGIMGPMTLECTCMDGYVFFEVGPAGDLAERLSRPDSITFDVKSLLPLLRPDLTTAGIRTALYASPSAAARRTLSGLGPILRPVMAELAPDGDGVSCVVVAAPGGDFFWGWSLTRTELEAFEKNKDVPQKTFKTILMHGVRLPTFGGN